MDAVPEYKIILLGEPGVGKTNFFLRFRNGTFAGSSAVSASMGTDVFDYTVNISGVPVKGVLYDTAGGERYRTLTSNYYLHSDAAILMYSVDDQHSFARLSDEVDNAAKFVSTDDFVWVLLGHKSDLSREVPTESVLALAKELNTKLYFFASAKTGENVVEVMEAVIAHTHKILRRRRGQSNAARGHRLSVAVNTTTKVTKSSSSRECSC